MSADHESDFEACPHGVDGDVCLICQGMRQQSKPCTSRLSDMTCQLPAGHLERHTHTLKATEWRWNSAGHSQCFALPPKPPRPESDLEPCANCGATSDEAELMDGSPRLCRDAVECYARLNGKLRDWVCAECGDEPAVNRREIVNGRKLCRSCAERTAVSESSFPTRADRSSLTEGYIEKHRGVVDALNSDAPSSRETGEGLKSELPAGPVSRHPGRCAKCENPIVNGGHEWCLDFLSRERDELRVRVAELEADLGALVGSLKWWNEDAYDREAPDWREYEQHLPKEASDA